MTCQLTEPRSAPTPPPPGTCPRDGTELRSTNTSAPALVDGDSLFRFEVEQPRGSGRSPSPRFFHLRGCRHPALLLKLRLDPGVGWGQAILQAGSRKPAENLSEPRVVAVSPPDTLRRVEPVTLAHGLAGDPGHEVHQLVDRHPFVRSKVERLRVVGLHDSVDAFDAVVHVEVRAALAAIPPHLDRLAVACQGHLPADGRRSLLTPPIVCAHRPVNVVEPS